LEHEGRAEEEVASRMHSIAKKPADPDAPTGTELVRRSEDAEGSM
jgi:hypothetical protein